MKQIELAYTIEGISPLLMSNPQAMFLAAGKEASKQKRQLSPEESAEVSAYRTADGFLGFPSVGVRNAMIEAAGAFKYKGARTWKGLVTHIQVEPADLMPLTSAKGKPLRDYEIDARRAVNKHAGAIIVHRAKLPTWRASFAFIADEEMLPAEDRHKLVKTFLLDAGSRIGIGAFRPSKMGWFGRFTVLD